MEIEKQFATYCQYFVKSTIGAGAQGKVKLANENGNNVALKFIKQVTPDVQKEVLIHQNLEHPYLVKFLNYHQDCAYKKKNGTIETKTCLAYEYVDGGELFEILAQTGKFKEEMARFFFQQLTEVLQYLQQRGIAHRDLKPENILFQDGNLKVSDLGFITFLGGKHGDGMLNTTKGTKGYMAPELMLKQTYNGQSVDVFACGVILYVMLTAQMPFTMAHVQDPFYNYLCTNRQEQFWQAKEKSLKASFSPELRLLLNSLLAFDPLQRPSIAEIKSHPWFQGPVMNHQAIQTILSSRKTKIDAQLMVEKLNLRLKKQEQVRKPRKIDLQLVISGIGTFKRDDEPVIPEPKPEVHRKLKQNKKSRIVLPASPDWLFDVLQEPEHFNRFANQIDKVSGTHYQLTYSYLNNQNEKNELQITLVDMKEGKIGLVFDCIAGNTREFYLKQVQIEDQILSMIESFEL